MRIGSTIIVLGQVVCLTAACVAAPTPTPMPTPTPPATATAVPTPIPTNSAADFPSDIPACAEYKQMASAYKFDWPDIDSLVEADWLYYRCGQKPADVAAFFKSKMTDPPYNWLENAWVVRDEGTLGVYFHTARQSWLYLWFLADTSSPQTSALVIVERTEAPLEMSCH